MRGPSAFILFCQDERKSLRAYHPKWSFSEVGKELGSMWRKLPADKKEVTLDSCSYIYFVSMHIYMYVITLNGYITLVEDSCVIRFPEKSQL